MMIRLLLSSASIMLCLSSIHSEAFAFVDVHKPHKHKPRRQPLDQHPIIRQTTQAQGVSASSSYDDRRYHSSPYRHHAKCCCLCASSTSNNNNNDKDDDENVVTTNDDELLAPHYTSQSVLSWVRKMADSYQIERGEDLLDVILRESSDSSTTYNDINSINNKKEYSNNNDDTMYLLKLAKACAKTNLPIASHDFLRDETGEAIYNYGNIAFLHGFGYEWDEFIQLPSRKCVETEGEVEERQRLLNDVKKNAIIVQQQQKQEQQQSLKNDNSTTIGDAAVGDDNDDDLSSKYDNLIRVRKDGKRILLKGVNLWNVYDSSLQGMHSNTLESIRSKIEWGEISAIGQAVWIRHVEYLD